MDTNSQRARNERSEYTPGLDPSHDSAVPSIDMGHIIASDSEVLSESSSSDVSGEEDEQLLSSATNYPGLHCAAPLSSSSSLHSVSVIPSAIGGTSSKDGQRASTKEYADRIDAIFNLTTLPSVVHSGSGNGASPRFSASGLVDDSRTTLADDHGAGEKLKHGVAEPSSRFFQSHDSFDEEQKTDTNKPLFPDSVTYLSIASILGGLIISVALVVGHHFFLSYLHARNIDDFSQFWIKGVSNSFATLFSVCLGFGATSALTQTKWRVAASKRAGIKNIDNLFALPGPLALCGILAHPHHRYFPPILATILIHALVLVSVLAPNSLTTARSQRRTQEIQAPTLDLEVYDQPMTALDWVYGIDMGPHQLRWMNVSALWEGRLLSTMLNPPDINWAAPPGCEAACTFEWQYEGPGLECRDIRPDEYILTNSTITSLFGNIGAAAYYANTTLFPNQIMPLLSAEDMQEPYDLSIQYTPVIPRNTSHDSDMYPGTGVYCQFRKTTYHASFELINNTRRVNTSVLSYGDPLFTRDCLSRLEDGPPQCKYGWPNSWAMCYTFASAFEGNITLGALYEVMQTRDLVAIGSMFNIAYAAQDLDEAALKTPFLWPKVANLSESLVGLFSNFTLGLIPLRGGTTAVKANVWDGNSVWNYTPWILWVVYMPAFLLAIPVTIHGLRSIQLNETGMEDKFSTFLLTARGADLDNVCKESEDFKALQRVQLVHRKKSVFTVESTDHAI